MPQPRVGPVLLASSPPRHLQHPAARLRAPPASLPPQPPFPRRVILGTQSLRGPRRNFSLGWEGGRNPGVLPASPPPGLPGRRGGAVAAPRGLPLGRRAEVQNIPGAGWGVGGSPLRPRRVSWKPEPGNRALPSHLLSEGPGGPGSALQTIFLPSPEFLDPGSILHSRTVSAQGPATFGAHGVGCPEGGASAMRGGECRQL